MTAGARHAALAGQPGVWWPVEACRTVQRVIEEACEAEARRYGRAWRPRPEVVEVLRFLRLAPLVTDLAGVDAASPQGSASGQPDDDGLMTTTEVAHELGLTRRRVAQLIDAGAFPGARRRGRQWFIPESEVC